MRILRAEDVQVATLVVLALGLAATAGAEERRAGSRSLSAAQLRTVNANSRAIFQVNVKRRAQAEASGLMDVSEEIAQLTQRLRALDRAERSLTESRRSADSALVTAAEARVASDRAALDTQLAKTTSLRQRVDQNAASLQDPRDRSAAHAARDALAGIEAEIQAALEMEGADRKAALARIQDRLATHQSGPVFPQDRGTRQPTIHYVKPLYPAARSLTGTSPASTPTP